MRAYGRQHHLREYARVSERVGHIRGYVRAMPRGNVLPRAVCNAEWAVSVGREVEELRAVMGAKADTPRFASYNAMLVRMPEVRRLLVEAKTTARWAISIVREYTCGARA